jgi:hypothetical protein
MLTGSSAVPPSSRTRASAAVMSTTAKKVRGCHDESSCGDPPMGSGRGSAGVLAHLDLDARGFQTSPMFTDTPVGIVMTAARQQGLEG